MTHAISRFGLAIHPDTNDLYLDGTNNLATVSDAEAVGQHVRQRLKTFYGEWFLDTEVGVTWLDDLLGKREDFPLAEAIVKAEIAETDGVNSILSFSVSFIKPRRELAINDVQVMTEYEEEAHV